MSTERDRTSENSHNELGSAEEPQRTGTSGPVWPDRVVPSWSVPPGLIAPQVAARDAERPAAPQTEAEPAGEDDDLPGMAPPAGWFLPPPGGSPQTADAEDDDGAESARRRRTLWRASLLTHFVGEAKRIV